MKPHIIENDDEINFEFIKPDARFGFWLDKNAPSNSGWTYVEKISNTMTSGELPAEMAEAFKKWLDHAAGLPHS